MPQITSLAGLALIGAVGAMTGAYLGKDTIDRINPVFFSPLPETHFYADDTPQGYSLGQADPIPAEHMWWNAVPRGPCLNCPDNFVDPVYASTTSEIPRWDQLAEIRAGVRKEMEQGAARLDAAVERYASFPVTREEAQVQTVRREEYAEQVALPRDAAEEDAEPTGM
jgi:hypothetical protein